VASADELQQFLLEFHLLPASRSHPARPGRDPAVPIGDRFRHPGLGVGWWAPWLPVKEQARTARQVAEVTGTGSDDRRKEFRVRRIIASEGITLDGYFAGSQGEIDWQALDEEFNAYSVELLDSVDTLLFGRVTYEQMQPGGQHRLGNITAQRLLAG
jgi:hypothetical protein